jgi:hypothetical protein
MNGEIEQMSSIVCCARKALYDHKDIEFTPGKFVESISFVFSSPFAFWRTNEANSVQKWYKICQKRGLCDVKFIIPTATTQRHLLGFANTSQGVIVCFWKNGKASCFAPMWDFNNQRNGWIITYREQRGIKLSQSEITYTNQTDAFKSILLEIGAFATKIGFPYFADVFHKAYEGLCDFSRIKDHRVPEHIPTAFKGIYYAVDTADVFGAMGSWNDSPPYYADQMGLEKEYNDLSDRLFNQLRYHLMYVVNQCWQTD